METFIWPPSKGNAGSSADGDGNADLDKEEIFSKPLCMHLRISAAYKFRLGELGKIKPIGTAHITVVVA